MRVLLLNQNHIGDALFTTPAIAALRRTHPDAAIVNATLAGVVPLFAANPHITEHWIRPPRGASAILSFVRRIRRGRFDAVIAMSASSTQFGLFARLSGAKVRIGFDHPAIRRFLTHPVPVRTGDQHHADDHLDQVRLLGPVDGPFPLQLFPLPDWAAEWRRVASELGLAPDAPLIGLNPGATVAKKQWAPERWAALASRLHTEGFQPLLFGGPLDATLVEDIRARCASPIPSAQGRLGIGGLAVAARSCAAFVSGDTGPLHVAVAMGTPVVALHGPTDPRRTGPYTDRAVILWHPEPGPDGTPMSGISVEDAAAAIPRAVTIGHAPAY